eukprot:g627.t1
MQEDLTVRKKWINIQNRLKLQLSLNDPDWLSSSAISRVAGVDISFFEDSSEKACACLVVLDWPSLTVLSTKSKLVKLTEPYISGFLAFRECDFFVDLLEELRLENEKLMPQVIFVDGNGVLHHRGFGVACQLGVLLNCVTIGVAKKLLLIDGLTNERTRELLDKEELDDKEEKKKMISVLLRGNSGKVHGCAIRKRSQTNPIYISCGNNISLKKATELVSKCCIYRIPEPIRQADITSRIYVREMKEEKLNTWRYTEGSSLLSRFLNEGL